MEGPVNSLQRVPHKRRDLRHVSLAGKLRELAHLNAHLNEFCGNLCGKETYRRGSARSCHVTITHLVARSECSGIPRRSETCAKDCRVARKDTSCILREVSFDATRGCGRPISSSSYALCRDDSLSRLNI